MDGPLEKIQEWFIVIMQKDLNHQEKDGGLLHLVIVILQK